MRGSGEQRRGTHAALATMDHATHNDIEDPLLPAQGYLPRRDGSGALAQSHDQEPGFIRDADGQAGFGACFTTPAFEAHH